MGGGWHKTGHERFVYARKKREASSVTLSRALPHGAAQRSALARQCAPLGIQRLSIAAVMYSIWLYT